MMEIREIRLQLWFQTELLLVAGYRKSVTWVEMLKQGTAYIKKLAKQYIYNPNDRSFFVRIASNLSYEHLQQRNNDRLQKKKVSEELTSPMRYKCALCFFSRERYHFPLAWNQFFVFRFSVREHAK